MDSYERLDWGQDRRQSNDYKRMRSPDQNPYRGRNRRDRERSRSPVHIDRYAPGRDRYDDNRDNRDRGDRGDRGDRVDRGDRIDREEMDRRRRTPPPNQAGIDRYVPKHDAQQNVITFNPIPDPMKLGVQAGFTYFAEWWRHEKMVKENKERQKNGGRGRPDRLRGEKESVEDRAKERELIQADYDDYKKKLQAEMARRFVEDHKSDEWFKERYEPETRDGLKAQLNDNRRGFYDKWSSDLSSGLFDEFTLEGIYKSESNGAGGTVEKEEGEAAAANEVLGVGDLLPTRGGDLRDETIVQPTLLIKTIAPYVSRANMEAFCKEHLGEGSGGFDWLSLSDPNPQKKFHRIGWVLLNPAAEGDAPVENERSDPRDGNAEEGEEGEDAAMATEPAHTVSVSVKALESINSKTIHDTVRGDFTCHVGIHEPPIMPRKKALWDLFSAPERIDRDLQLATRLANRLDMDLGEGYDAVSKIADRVEDMRNQGLLQPTVSAPTTKKPKSQDDEDMDDDEDEGAVDEDDDEGAIDEENDDENLLVKKKQLDLLVEYLRRVYHFCIFCVFESDSVHELTRKCPGGHLRRPRASLTTSAKTVARASARGETFPYKKDALPEGEESGSPEQARKPRGFNKTQQQLERAFKWVKTYEEKLLQLLDPESIDITKLGGKPAEEALEDALSKYVTQEDEAKFRCKVPDCTKLFKGLTFWRKHIEKRHEEFYTKIKQDVSLINAYVLDPAHIAPSRSDATSNGHFPIKHDSGMTGTPRGFNYNAHAANAMGLPGYMAAGFPGQNVMQMASMMGGPGAMFNGAMMPGVPPGYNPMGAAGAIRQGRRTDNRMAGPYDRTKDNRNARWQPNGQPGTNGMPSMGRLSPPRGGMPPMAGMMGMPPVPGMLPPGAAGAFTRAQGPPRFGEGGAGPLEATNGRQLRSYQDLDASGDNGATEDLDY